MASGIANVDGSNAAWNATMLTVIGAKSVSAKGTNRLLSRSAPTRTSVPLIRGNM